MCAHALEEIQSARVCLVRRSLALQETKTHLWHPAFLGGKGVGTGVEPSNFKIGVGVGSGIAGADGANFEIGTPDPGCADSAAFVASVSIGSVDRLAHGGNLRQGVEGGQDATEEHLIEVPAKYGFE